VSQIDPVFISEHVCEYLAVIIQQYQLSKNRSLPKSYKYEAFPLCAREIIDWPH